MRTADLEWARGLAQEHHADVVSGKTTSEGYDVYLFGLVGKRPISALDKVALFNYVHGYYDGLAHAHKEAGL